MKKTIYIKGMHCISCEVLLTKQIDVIEGVKIVNISHKTGKVTLELSDYKLFDQVKDAIDGCGYTLGDKEAKDISCAMPSKKKNNWISILIIFAVVGGLMFLLKKFNIYQYLPSTDNVTIGVALLMGLVASVSTCLAVTGSVVLGFGEYIDDSKGWLGHLRVQGSFHIGRILGFFLLGGVLGLVGQVFKISIGANAVLTMLVGIVLFYMGLHMLGVVPNITKFGFHIPKKLTKNIFNVRNPIFAPIIGALTFFLPCGFTQSMQLVAIGSGDFWQGGLVMAMFALGTMPILLGVGLGGSYIKEHKFTIVNKIIGALIVFFGIFSISNGRGLIGVGTTTLSVPEVDYSQYSSSAPQVEVSYEKLEVGHNGWEVEPQKVELEYGKNYELTILPSSNGVGCMSTMIIPKVNRKINRIIKGKAITYKLEGLKKGTYPIVCASMGMYQGELVVK